MIQNIPNRFDIVIPLGKNDIDIIREQIIYTKRNVIGYRNIYIITNMDFNLSLDGCIIIDENSFPFTKSTVASVHGVNDRNGWYLQQLLKLYAGIVIPGVLDRYLVIDADTFFLKPTQFIENDKCLYNYSGENHLPYYEHMAKMIPGLIKTYPDKSGICHHMMFETKWLRELFQKIETIHGDFFFNCFLRFVTDIYNSGASEYELYFHYMCQFHNDEISIRKLKFVDAPVKHKTYLNANSTYDYASYHWYRI